MAMRITAILDTRGVPIPVHFRSSRLLLKWTGIGTPLVSNIAVILMAMPTALNGSMLAMEYGGDTECMAQSIFLTTLMSIITIPVLAALL